ncbi:single-stranded DNA-binding protein [Streptomyces sp. NPDC015346]|uniref:single-stranded DNA-binding protein n=1 Tax=Streptomyces sp. NPDC015346 TaxID=3364954 RepID=UPI0036FA4ACF
MNDTMVTLVGNVATSVEYRDTATGGVARFRFAVTARRWDRERGTWVDGHTSFYTVFAWRALGANLAASVSVGEPLVVHGRLKVREEEREGQGQGQGQGQGLRKTFVDIDALAVGHDLTRGTAAFRRVVKGEPRVTERQENGAAGPNRDPWDTDPAARPEDSGPASSLTPGGVTETVQVLEPVL